MDMILWGLFECTFVKKHSVFGDQTSLSTSAAHSNVARVSLSVAMPPTGEEVELDFDIGQVESFAPTNQNNDFQNHIYRRPGF